jgi:hypothetical protein
MVCGYIMPKVVFLGRWIDVNISMKWQEVFSMIIAKSALLGRNGNNAVYSGTKLHKK